MYKPRFSLKNILQVPTTLISNQSKSYVNNEAKNLKIEKCLVISKLSRYEFERNKYKDLTDKEFTKLLKARGSNYERILHHHNLHKLFETRFIDTLRKLGIQVRVVNRYTYVEESIEWADVIFPTGGDGTFLLAASKIHDNLKPVIGFNSDPHRSEGHLCLPKKYSENIVDAIKRLRGGEFDWLNRSRIRTTLINHVDNSVKFLHNHEDFEIQQQVAQAVKSQQGKVLPVLALNEVFIGENLSARVSHLEMKLDNLKNTSVKCSGLCVCTGTGSTSWNLSINRLTCQSVRELLKVIKYQTEADPRLLSKQVSDIYNKDLIFPSDDKKMAYTIRDLISVGVWPQPKGIEPRGYASRITVKSVCYDAGLVIDGGLSFSFNDGTVAVLEIYPEDSLRTVYFNE